MACFDLELPYQQAAILFAVKNLQINHEIKSHFKSN